MERMQAAKAIQEQMQAAHRLWDAYREQGGDPADLVDEARGWREKSGETLQVVMEDASVGESFMRMTEGPARLNNPFELFKVGLELLDALMRDLGAESAVKAAAKPATPAAPAAPAASTAAAAPAVEANVAASAATTPEEPKAPPIQASIGIVSKVAPTAPPTRSPTSSPPPVPEVGAPKVGATPRTAPDISKTLAEVRIAIEMTDLPHAAREDHLVQLAQLEKVFAVGAETRDVALGRSAIRSLTHAADRVPNIASRLMTLLDALLA